MNMYKKLMMALIIVSGAMDADQGMPQRNTKQILRAAFIYADPSSINVSKEAEDKIRKKYGVHSLYAVLTEPKEEELSLMYAKLLQCKNNSNTIQKNECFEGIVLIKELKKNLKKKYDLEAEKGRPNNMYADIFIDLIKIQRQAELGQFK